MAITVRALEFAPETTPEQVCAAIERSFSTNNPDIGKIQSCILRDGPQVYKFAVIHEIIDRHSGEHHHNALTLKSFKKLKGGWERQDERTIVFDDQTHDEIGLLEKFISDFRDYTNQERKTYGVVESVELEKYNVLSRTEVGDTIREILEDADSYKRIVEQGGLALVKDVVEWVFQQDNAEPIIEQLNSLNIDTLRELTTVAGISQINKILEIWKPIKRMAAKNFGKKP